MFCPRCFLESLTVSLVVDNVCCECKQKYQSGSTLLSEDTLRTYAKYNGRSDIVKEMEKLIGN